MDNVRLYKSEDLPEQPVPQPGKVSAQSVVTEEVSQTLGGGLLTLDDHSYEWDMTYDEVLFVHKGVLRVAFGEDQKQVLEGGPGDIFWLPKGARVTYSGEGAVVFFAVFPVNWRATISDKA